MPTMMPMLIYGEVVSSYGFPVITGTVSAVIEGASDGQPGTMAISSSGSFGGPGGLDPKLALYGTAADIGKPVKFSVDGTPAAASVPVTFQPGAILNVRLTINQQPAPQPQPVGKVAELQSLLQQALAIVQSLQGQGVG